MNINFESLYVTSPSGQKILSNVSGLAERGKLTSLMGASGSGKTTLLATLARRFEPNLKYRGVIHYDGEVYDVKKHGKRCIAFVRQDDVVLEYLTVFEFLEFSAHLRLDLPLEQINERIESIIKQLRLDKCRNTMLGGIDARGVSGGERKRAAIGNELLTQPKVLLTDEPTSGLDSTLSVVVVDILKDLAATNGLTVLTTIHSPSSAIFERFDSLIILDQGVTFYAGKAKDLVAYLLSAYQLVVPPSYNPADFMMDILVLEKVEKKQFLSPPSIAAAVGDDDLNLAKEEEEESDAATTNSLYATSRPRQVSLLVQRMWKKERSIILSKDQALAYAGLTVIASLLFFQMGYTEAYLLPRSALALWLSGTFMYMGTFSSLMALHMELPLVKKEVFDGSYHLSSHFLAKQLVIMPNTALWLLLFSIITLACTNLAPSVGVAVYIMFALQISLFMFQGVGFFLSALVPMSTLVTVGIVVVTYFFAFNGFFVPFSAMAAWYEWLRWPCVQTYSFQLLLLQAFPPNVSYQCSTPNSQFCTGTGTTISSQQILTYFGVDLSLTACFVTMTLIGIFSRVLAFLIFQWKMKPPKGLNDSKKNKRWRLTKPIMTRKTKMEEEDFHIVDV